MASGVGSRTAMLVLLQAVVFGQIALRLGLLASQIALYRARSRR